jgi:transglutaminase-like putative cysteine protease
MQVVRDVPSRVARVLFVGLMTFAWCGGVPQAVSVAAAQPAAPARPVGDELQQKSLAVLRRLCEYGKEVVNKPGANPADVPGTALQLGNDVTRVFDFVRTQVAYEPYRGVLRGGRGALASRAGNALDKSLLLKQMLEAGGSTCRLVRGQLAPDKAAALVDQFLAADPLKGPLGDFVPSDAAYQVPPDFARRSGLDEQLLKEFVDRSRRQFDALIAEAWRLTDAQAKYLGEQLEKAKVTIGRSAGAWRDELVARATDHAWVEFRPAGDGAGDRWVALDPSFADAKPGAVFGTGGAPLDDKALSGERHTLRFALVYRTEEGGSAKENVLLDETLPVDALFWEPLGFSIDPADPLPPPSKLVEMKPEAGIKLLTSVKKFQGVLTSGGKRFASRVFDTSGGIYDVAADGRVKGAGQVGASVGGLFGGGGLGGGGDEKPANTFTDLSVLITFQSPGGKAAPQRRVLLTKQDLAGEHALNPMLGWQILVQTGAISAEVDDYQRLSAALPVLDPMLDAVQAGPPAAALDKVGADRQKSHPALVADLALWRQAATARLVRDNPKVRPLWDRPQMAIAEQRFCANKSTGHACGRAAIDIVDNSISMVPTDDAASAPAALAALRQGVFDTAAEAVLLKSVAGGAADVRGAIADAEQARSAAGDLVVFAPADAATAAAGGVGEPDKAWIKQFEPAGRRILAPRGAVASGAMWWSLDPETGTILGRGAGGRGQSLTEYIVQVVICDMCLIFVLINYWLDTKGNGTDKQRLGLVINAAGCLLGLAGGAAGVKVGAEVGKGALGASWPHIVNLINAGIAGGVSLAGGAAAR